MVLVVNGLMKTINPFMIVLAIVQVLACIYEFWKGNKYVALLYLCYAIANVLLILISKKISE